MTSSPSTRSNRDGVAVALAQAARVIDGTDTLDETLDAIVRAAQATIPSFEHVGISVVHDDGRIETRAGTGALVRELDDLQVELCEGPCYDAMDGKVLMVLEDARDDARWPRYLPLAARKGLRAQMGLQLFSEDGTLGGLNFYSTRPGVSSELSVVRSIRVMALRSQATCQSFFTVRRVPMVAARRSRAERFKRMRPTPSRSSG